jgi:predicted RNase H-like HicB family nuclease
MRKLTATIKKGEKQYIALCQELDVVSQGYSVEEAIKNLKEAVELYLEEEGYPSKEISGDTILVNFEVKDVGKTSEVVR